MERALARYRDGTEVRRSRPADSPRVAELLELNGMSRRLAGEEAFLVAERGGEVLAALAYSVGVRRLSVGVPVADPWEPERPLARMLYAEAYLFAREMGLEEVHALAPCTGITPEMSVTVAGAARWHLGTDDGLGLRGELPEGGWQRALALWGATAVPFFRAFRPFDAGKSEAREKKR
jgi:hypothetical protein